MAHRNWTSAGYQTLPLSTTQTYRIEAWLSGGLGGKFMGSLNQRAFRGQECLMPSDHVQDNHLGERTRLIGCGLELAEEGR